MSGVQILKIYLKVKWSGIRNVWKMSWILVSTSIQIPFKYRIGFQSGIWMVLITPNNQTQKSLVFRWFWYLDPNYFCKYKNVGNTVQNYSRCFLKKNFLETEPDNLIVYRVRKNAIWIIWVIKIIAYSIRTSLVLSSIHSVQFLFVFWKIKWSTDWNGFKISWVFLVSSFSANRRITWKTTNR